MNWVALNFIVERKMMFKIVSSINKMSKSLFTNILSWAEHEQNLSLVVGSLLIHMFRTQPIQFLQKLMQFKISHINHILKSV